LKQKKLPQSYLVEFDAVDLLEICFLSLLGLLGELMVDRDDSVIFGAFEKDEVLRLNFQKVN
jgi:hypothetical protein